MTTEVDLDRVAGALLGMAAGDALGAGYEFTTPGPDVEIVMEGGGACGWAPGEWTDDTAQAVGIADVLATGRVDLEAIGQRFLDWYGGRPKDVGISTRAVLAAATGTADLPRRASAYFAQHPRGAAGNGSLMRTAPVALARLGDDEGIAELARAVSHLTHGDPLAAEGCVLWCIAIDRAVREGRLDGVHDGLAQLAPDRRPFWAERLVEAETRPPSSFTRNGFVVTALQAAHAAITQTPVPADQPCRHLQDALVTAVRIGDDTDTVAAIAGQVLGARWGSSAVPWRWRRRLHGWDGYRADDLVRLAVLTAQAGAVDAIGWPSAGSLMAHSKRYESAIWCNPLPADPDVLVGNHPGLEAALDEGVDAVISMCRIGREEVPAPVEHLTFRLIDKAGAAHNANVEFVLDDAVDALTTLRGEGKRVFLHCQGGRSRTAAVAAAYTATMTGTPAEDTLPELRQALPQGHLNVFGDILRACYPGAD
ncbi:ADP-ribosylglycohydrolase family protein [soil metagenome]